MLFKFIIRHYHRIRASSRHIKTKVNIISKILGLCHIELKQYTLAIQTFNEALNLDSKCFFSYCQKGYF